MTGDDITGEFNLYDKDGILIRDRRMMSVPVHSILLTEYA